MSQQHEYVPIGNRRETIHGVSITFQLLSVIAVVLRIFARSRLATGLGVDDLFVVLACIATAIGATFVNLEPGVGLGRHQQELTYDQLSKYLQYTFGSIVSYVVGTALIKISILYQYSRLARAENYAFRRICLVLIAFVSVWGIIFFFGTLFSCVPISGYWHPFKPAKCILFGSFDRNVRVQAYVGHASTNMVLDILIFATPLYLMKNFMNLSQRSKIGLFAVFAFGGLVVVVSILRLASILNHDLGLIGEVMDVTWYAAPTVLWSCIEVNIAVVVASIPIFWPVLTEIAFGKIMVTNVVEVRSQAADSVSRLSSSGGERYDDTQELTHSVSWGNAYQKTFRTEATGKV